MLDLIQGTEDWHTARRGKVTASRVADVIAKTQKGQYTAARGKYMMELMVERLTGTTQPCYVNAAMQWGTDHEDEARQLYSFNSEEIVTAVGFVDHPTIALTGASPDGLCGDQGLVEIKCPNTATHLETLMSGAMPVDHLPQVNWQMACTGRQWCDFVSYDPRLPAHLQMFVCRETRDEATVEHLEKEVALFLAELDEKIACLTREKEAA